ncbi:hypothetical protein [Bifidobacterium stellenboschense]|uniref:Uncharacterized protein n=1 Tax=Bifidobacterium stellenboschense TaxID=762211 RepID=A0A087DPV8_9BIFI|nr:hypothetical protein [Bifidobacterium stellenboschense]KFI97558.1 hypothetical protein BSTEL_0279 [Bifidobacterium stellenboschense]
MDAAAVANGAERTMARVRSDGTVDDEAVAGADETVDEVVVVLSLRYGSECHIGYRVGYGTARGMLGTLECE